MTVSHRISVDFDLFSVDDIDKNLLQKVRKTFGKFAVSLSVNNPCELTIFVGNVKTTFLKYQFVVNEKTCKYLPVIDVSRWNDGDKFTPHCGFARAYGASDYLDGNLARRYSEDVSTFIEQLYFNPGVRSQGDFLTDQRYKQKEAILHKYGFI